MLGVKGHRRVIVRTWHGGQLSLPGSLKLPAPALPLENSSRAQTVCEGARAPGFSGDPPRAFTRERVQQRCFSYQTRAHMPFF